MSWRARRANSRDANGGAVIAALKAAGLVVWEIDSPVDLLVHNPKEDRFLLLEVKNPARRQKDGSLKSASSHLRPSQRELIELAPRDFAIVWTAEEAVEFCTNPNRK